MVKPCRRPSGRRPKLGGFDMDRAERWAILSGNHQRIPYGEMEAEDWLFVVGPLRESALDLLHMVHNITMAQAVEGYAKDNGVTPEVKYEGVEAETKLALIGGLPEGWFAAPWLLMTMEGDWVHWHDTGNDSSKVEWQVSIIDEQRVGEILASDPAWPESVIRGFDQLMTAGWEWAIGFGDECRDEMRKCHQLLDSIDWSQRA